MIDPFSFGVDNLELQRLSSLAMMRCFSDILHDSRIPDNIRQSVYLQTVNLETVYSVGDTTDITRSTHLLRQLCLSVYTQAMRPNSFNNLAKTLTGFGPASSAERYLKSIDAKVSVEILWCGTKPVVTAGPGGAGLQTSLLSSLHPGPAQSEEQEDRRQRHGAKHGG